MNTLRVMDGSPEKSCIVFEMARFVAGSIALATRKMSSSLSLNSRLFSTLSLFINRWRHSENTATLIGIITWGDEFSFYLWYSEFEKNDKPRNKSPSWEIAEKILKTWNPQFLDSLDRKNIEENWDTEIEEQCGGYLKLIPLVKQEERKQTEPKPNQKLDLEASFHIIKSVTSCPILCRLLRSSSLASETSISQRVVNQII